MNSFPRDDRDVLHAATVLRSCLHGLYVPHIWRDILGYAHYEPTISATATFKPDSWKPKEQRRLTLEIPPGLERDSIEGIEARVGLGDLVLYFGSGMLSSSFRAAACVYVTPPGRTAPHLIEDDLDENDAPFMKMFGFEDACSRADCNEDCMEAVGIDPTERDLEADPINCQPNSLPNGLKQQLNLNDKRLSSIGSGWRLTLAIPPLRFLEKISSCTLRIAIKTRVNFERMQIIRSAG